MPGGLAHEPHRVPRWLFLTFLSAARYGKGLSDFLSTRGSPSEAEGMPGWVGVDAEAWLGARKARGTQRQHPGLGSVMSLTWRSRWTCAGNAGSGRRGGW